jgi:pimeloyl-ACP methyl ester carboxylesterase
MTSVKTLPGISSEMIQTKRINTHILTCGPENGVPVFFIHGNASSATFWEEIMLKMADDYRCIAPDLRGYGDTEDLLIDAIRGLGDWIDDLISLMDALNIEKAHFMGHSLGGTIVMGMAAYAGQRVLSIIPVNPGSMYGFGGSKDIDGNPCYPDFAGSGGGIVNPDFPKLIAAGDRSADNPQASPRVVMNSFYWKAPFVPERIEELLSSLLTEKIGEQKYPGDFVPSNNWPNVAPGKFGPINALSPKYVGDSIQRFVNNEAKAPVLWIRGDSDLVVSDNSFFDFGTLGKLGYVPGWPGEDIYPPQPMVSQTRHILEKYAANGGAYEEKVVADTGHSPFIEKPDEFTGIVTRFLADKK